MHDGAGTQALAQMTAMETGTSCAASCWPSSPKSGSWTV